VNPRLNIGYHPARILIVDDEHHNRHLLEVMLTPDGYLLQTAASGEEALAMVALQSPDLILLDIMMPGMDGYEVATRIKSDPTTKNIPVILVTVLDDRSTKMRGLSAGAEEFLTKPVDRIELCVRVKNLLRLKAYGDYYDKYSQMLEGQVASRTADLVERTRQAAVLAEQAALLDLAQDAIIVRDLDGRILFWSRGAAALYGWSSHEALGRQKSDLLKMTFFEPGERIEARLLREGVWEGEAIHHTRDGTRLTVASRWALQRDADGTPERVLTINNDITSRKQADSERRLLTERLSLATAVAQVGVWDWDLASDTLTWDATMFDIYRLPPLDRMPYASWSSAIYTDDLPAVDGALQRVIEHAGQGSVDFRIRLPDGSIKHTSAVARAIVDEHAKVVRVIGVNMDITARKAAEDALEHNRQAQLRFKDEFLSHVSHELRSPLTAIKQFTTILLGGVAGDLNHEQREYQQIVLRNIHQLQSMIDDLLEVTRLETGKLTIAPERVSLAAAVTDTLHTLQVTAAAKGVTLSCDLPHDLPFAHADPTRLRQILIILLDNAIKFTPGGGAVSVLARRWPSDPAFLLLEVSDTGCGLAPELTERIFERLHQAETGFHTSRKGLGLGLYICKELVTRQGGDIWAKGQPPQGSVFSFTLPVFTLNDVIGPLLKNANWPTDSVAMITIWSRGVEHSKTSHDEWADQTRGLVQRCLLPDLDVLLPNVFFSTEGERLFVIAFADDKGASALAIRIREQLERHLKPSGRTIHVSHSMLPPIPRPVDASIVHLVAHMAARVEDAIESQISSEAVPHE